MPNRGSFSSLANAKPQLWRTQTRTKKLAVDGHTPVHMRESAHSILKIS
jgi:hypothetical protein